MYYAYILKSDRDPTVLYHGFTSNLRKRLTYHNSGANPSTRAMASGIIGGWQHSGWHRATGSDSPWHEKTSA